MAYLCNMNCCAIAELDDLSANDTPEGALEELITEEPGHLARKPFVVFSGVIGRGIETGEPLPTYFWDFVRLIRNNNLGLVRVNRPRLNPNSGNEVSVAMWTPDMEAINRWHRGLGRRGRRED